ncbi:MAG: LysE family translocator [Chloroflexota bacterium]
MIEPSQLAIFVAAALALLITPGPAVLYIVARSIDQGRRAGLASVLGIEVGSLCQVMAAGLGLSALLVSSAAAFTAVKYLGAAYLIFLGVRRLREKDLEQQALAPPPEPLSRVVAQGVLVQVFNPKTALFFLAFLPQFVDPSKGQMGPQFLQLGAVWLALATCSDGLYALLAGSASHWLRGNLTFLRSQRYLTGGVFLALGIGTGLVDSGPK